MIISICDREVHFVLHGLTQMWEATIRTARDEALKRPHDVILGMETSGGVHGFVLDPHVDGGGLRYAIAVAASLDACISCATETLMMNNQPFVALLRADAEQLAKQEQTDATYNTIYDDATSLYFNQKGDRPRRFEAIRAGRYHVSVQASEGHHCYPRLTTNDLGKYLLWEVSTSWPLSVPSVFSLSCDDPYLLDLQRKLDREEAGWVPTHIVQRYLDFLASLPDGPELSP